MASEGSPQMIFEPNRHLRRLSCASARRHQDFATYLENYCYIHAGDVGNDKSEGEGQGGGSVLSVLRSGQNSRLERLSSRTTFTYGFVPSAANLTVASTSRDPCARKSCQTHRPWTNCAGVPCRNGWQL